MDHGCTRQGTNRHEGTEGHESSQPLSLNVFLLSSLHLSKLALSLLQPFPELTLTWRSTIRLYYHLGLRTEVTRSHSAYLWASFRFYVRLFF